MQHIALKKKKLYISTGGKAWLKDSRKRIKKNLKVYIINPNYKH